MKKVIEQFTCDSCGKEIQEGKQSTVRVADSLTGKTRLGDLCSDCASRIPTTREMPTPGKIAKEVRLQHRS